jgi:SAM-dependent methyltransferase
MVSEADDAALERLELILGGHVFFQLLRAAVTLDLFTLLARHPGASLDRLVQLTGVARKPMRILLLGCTALRLIVKENIGYHNSSIAESRLSRDSPTNILPTVEFAHRLVYRGMYHLADAIRANSNVGLSEFPGDEKTLYERLSHAPELEQVFHDGLQASSSQNVEQLIAHMDFSTIQHVLDVGGGTATALCALARRYAHLHGTVLDSPSVCALARTRIAAAGLSPRITAYEANGCTDPFPRGADCILLMHFLTIWAEETNLELMRKSYDALPAGGSIVVFDGAQNNDGTGPLRAARWSPYFLVLSSGEGMFYTPDEYTGWMRQTGFVDIRQIQTAPDHLLIVGQRP